jgi:DNA-binding CsgD family transcriptional regulator
MMHLILWTDMLVFALLLAGMGAEYLAYLKKREVWRGYYILSILSYALILLVQAIAYFNHHYIASPIPALYTAAVVIHPLASVLLAIAFPACVVKASAMELGKAGKAMAWLPALVTLLAIVSSFLLSSVVIASAVNITLNAFFCAFSVAGLIRVARGKGEAPRSAILPFLLLSSLAYAAFVVMALLLVSGLMAPSDAAATPFVSGLFCLAWSILLIVSALGRAKGRPDGPLVMGEGFAAGFGLSPREAEVSALLAAGKTNREIGEALFISTRTVETHVYNVYRKSGCRNKAEFVAKALSFRKDDGGGAAPERRHKPPR